MVAQPVSQPRAAIYVRVSTDKQGENYSLPTQEARCRAYAAEHGYQVAEVYRETHTGTELWERPELTRLRQAMARGELDALIVFDPDRFSRKQVHTALLQGICEQAGVELLFAEFDFTRDATGQFLLNARVFAAELEREKIMERTQRGMQARLRSGKLPRRVPELAHGRTGRRKPALGAPCCVSPRALQSPAMQRKARAWARWRPCAVLPRPAAQVRARLLRIAAAVRRCALRVRSKLRPRRRSRR